MTKTRFLTPAGRFVQGSVDEPQVKDAQGALRVVKTGPNAGQPNPQFFLGVAFAKNSPEWPVLWRALVTKAVEEFPNLFPHGAQGVEAIVAAGGPTMIPQGWCVHPQFAFKVIDGDGLDTSGKSNATKDGFAGHWVVRFASAYPPRCFYAGRYAAHEQIQEKGVIKRGYFVRVSGTAEGNGNAQRPGLYVNLDMIELAAYGPEIVSGPDAGEAFGAGPAALPAGASATPLTPPAAAPPGAPGVPPVPAPGVAPSPAAGLPAPVSPPHDPFAAALADGWVLHPTTAGYYYRGQEVVAAADLAARYPAPAPAPALAPPAAPPAPYAGYMAPPAAPPTLPPAPGAPAASPPAPAPGPGGLPIASPGSAPPPLAPPPLAPAPAAPVAAGPVMLPAAGGATYAQMIAAGWTDDTLRTHGMMQ